MVLALVAGAMLAALWATDRKSSSCAGVAIVGPTSASARGALDAYLQAATGGSHPLPVDADWRVVSNGGQPGVAFEANDVGGGSGTAVVVVAKGAGSDWSATSLSGCR